MSEWLIDIIKEWVQDQGYLTTSYVHRGDPGTWDFQIPNLTLDAAWHELDLSAIVPAGAKAVHLLVTINNTAIGRAIQFRHTSQGGVSNVAFCKIKVATISDWFDIVQALDTNRKIDYYADALGWTFVGIVVRGWWL